MKYALQVFVLIVAASTGSADTAPHVIRLEATSPGRVFEGIGTVSAGASTRLLVDYPESQRAQIPDFLLKPKFGAGFQHLKVEISSGENSTCGSEPSQVITREELADPKPRGYEFWQVFDILEKDPELDRLIGAVGYHCVDGRKPWDIDQQGRRDGKEKAKRSGKPLCASEEWSQCGKEWGGKGALYLARLIKKLYTRDRITKFQIWCPIDSIYDQIIWSDTGVMQADTPWCGHYTVWPAVWAIAHTTRFAEPGWGYVDGACGQIDTNTWRDSHEALRDPKTGHWSLVLVSGEKRTLQLAIAPGMTSGPVYVWKSAEAAQFVQQPPLSLRNNSLVLELDSNAIHTLITTTGQQKGSYGAPPPKRPFPFPFDDNFENCHPGDTPRFFSDQKGTFEVAKQPKGGQCLVQMVPAQGILWYDNWLLKPHTLFGDTNWQNFVIEADVFLAGGDVEIGGGYAKRDKLSYRWIVTRDGRWQLNWQYTTLPAGQVVRFDPAAWHQLRLKVEGDQIIGHVDGRKLATVTDTSGAKGIAFLASSYDRDLFDNVRVAPLAAAHALGPNVSCPLTDDQRHADKLLFGSETDCWPLNGRLGTEFAIMDGLQFPAGVNNKICRWNAARLFCSKEAISPQSSGKNE